jgi:hypothetical protein
MALGQEDRALASFQHGVERRELEVLELFVGIRGLFEGLAAKPEFTGLLQDHQAGLPGGAAQAALPSL